MYTRTLEIGNGNLMSNMILLLLSRVSKSKHAFYFPSVKQAHSNTILESGSW